MDVELGRNDNYHMFYYANATVSRAVPSNSAYHGELDALVAGFLGQGFDDLRDLFALWSPGRVEVQDRGLAEEEGRWWVKPVLLAVLDELGHCLVGGQLN